MKSFPAEPFVRGLTALIEDLETVRDRASQHALLPPEEIEFARRALKRAEDRMKRLAVPPSHSEYNGVAVCNMLTRIQ